MNVWRLSLSNLVVLLGVPLAFFVTQAYAQSGPPPETVRITDFTFSGTGCNPALPPTAVQARISTNQHTLTLHLPKIMAKAGPGVPRASQRRGCTVILNVAYPAGWQFAIRSVHSRGLAKLGAKVEGSVLSSYFFQGVPTAASFENALTGPFIDTFEFRSELLREEELLGPCGGGRSLVIQNEARVNSRLAGKNAVGHIILGQDDTAVLIFGLIWREC